MDLNEIKVFVAVVKNGSFTKASLEMGLPKSTLSRKVTDLEHRLGMTLLQRTTRQIRLTSPGEAFYLSCQKAIQEIYEAHDNLLNEMDIPRGKVRITTPAEPGFEFIKVISKFQKAYPLINLEIEMTNRQVDLVKEGFDIALRGGKLADSTLKFKKISEGNFVLVASPDYLENHKKIKDPIDLKNHKLVVFMGPADALKWKLTLDGKSVEIKVDQGLFVNSAQACKQLVIEGAGICLLPEHMVRDSIHTGELMRILPKWCGPKTYFNIIYPPQKSMPKRVRVLLDFFIESLGKS